MEPLNIGSLLSHQLLNKHSLKMDFIFEKLDFGMKKYVFADARCILHFSFSMWARFHAMLSLF